MEIFRPELSLTKSIAGVPDVDVAAGPTAANSALTHVAAARAPLPFPVAVYRGPTWLQNLRDFLHFVVLIGGAAYGSYFVWKVTKGFSFFISFYMFGAPFISLKYIVPFNDIHNRCEY
jgi:hypothetical protein